MTATSAARSRFAPATRRKTKLRLAIDGPAGSGKTMTLLRFAFALAGQNGRVALIDSEHGSASKYQGDAPDGIPWNFDALDLHSFAPTEYTAAIEDAGRNGYDVLVIDGLSQAWQGADGALELVTKKGGNSFTAWKDVTPMHNRMIEAILAAPMHVLVSMRSKVEYVLETDEKGKQVPRKVGMAPIQRAGMEYEFDVYGSLDWSHVLTISKSRCPAIDGQIVVKPGPAFLDPVIRWLETGEIIAPKPIVRIMADDAQVERIVSKIGQLGSTLEKEKKEIFRRYTAPEFVDLTAEQAGDYEQRLDIRLAKKAGDAAAPATAPATQPAATIPPNNTTFGAADEAAAVSINANVVANEPATPAAPAAPSVPDNVKSLKLTDPGKIHALWEWFAFLSGMNQEAKMKAWADVLAKRGVAALKDMGVAQRSVLGSNLLNRIVALHTERGDLAACPFDLPAATPAPSPTT